MARGDIKIYQFLLNGFPHPSPLNVGSNNILKKNKVNFINTVKKFFENKNIL